MRHVNKGTHWSSTFDMSKNFQKYHQPLFQRQFSILHISTHNNKKQLKELLYKHTYLTEHHTQNLKGKGKPQGLCSTSPYNNAWASALNHQEIIQAKKNSNALSWKESEPAEGSAWQRGWVKVSTWTMKSEIRWEKGERLGKGREPHFSYKLYSSAHSHVPESREGQS